MPATEEDNFNLMGTGILENPEERLHRSEEGHPKVEVHDLSCVLIWNICSNSLHNTVAHQDSEPLVFQVLPDTLNTGFLDEIEIGPYLVPVLICGAILRTDRDHVVGAHILRKANFQNLFPVSRRYKHLVGNQLSEPVDQ